MVRLSVGAVACIKGGFLVLTDRFDAAEFIDSLAACKYFAPEVTMSKFVYLLMLVLLATKFGALCIEQAHFGFNPGAERNYKQGNWIQSTTDLSEGSGKSWDFSLPEPGYVYNSYHEYDGHSDFPTANLCCQYTQYVIGIHDEGTSYLQNDGTDIITLGYTGSPNMVWNPGIPHGLPHTLGKTWQGTHTWAYGTYTVSGKVLSEGTITIPLGTFPALCVSYHYVSTYIDYYLYQWETAEYGIVAYANTLNGNMLYVLEEAEANGSAVEDNLVEGVPGLKIYPNPVSDKIWIKAPAQGNWDISLYDIRGRKVHTLGNYMAKDPAEAIQIELGKHKLSSGLYILQASFEGKKQRHRIVLKN